MSSINQSQLTEKGGQFIIASVPKPEPKPNEVVYRNKAVALNPLDVKQRDYGVLVEAWPKVLGYEGAGIVEAVGSDVKGFKQGDEVYSLGSGAFAEVWSVPAIVVGKKPSSLSFEEATSLPSGYITAAAAIHLGLKMPLPWVSGTSSASPDFKSVLVLGGSSAVGSSAIQLLRLSQPDLKILTTASSRNHALVKSLGADHAADQNSSSVVSDIRNATPDGKGVDAIVDPVAGGSQYELFETLRADGPRVYSQVATGADDFKKPEGIPTNPIRAFGLMEVPGGVNAMAALTGLIEQGKYKVPIKVKTVGHGLEEIPKALDEMKAGVSATKLVVTL